MTFIALFWVYRRPEVAGGFEQGAATLVRKRRIPRPAPLTSSPAAALSALRPSSRSRAPPAASVYRVLPAVDRAFGPRRRARPGPGCKRSRSPYPRTVSPHRAGLPAFSSAPVPPASLPGSPGHMPGLPWWCSARYVKVLPVEGEPTGAEYMGAPGRGPARVRKSLLWRGCPPLPRGLPAPGQATGRAGRNGDDPDEGARSPGLRGRCRGCRVRRRGCRRHHRHRHFGRLEDESLFAGTHGKEIAGPGRLPSRAHRCRTTSAKSRCLKRGARTRRRSRRRQPRPAGISRR